MRLRKIEVETEDGRIVDDGGTFGYKDETE